MRILLLEDDLNTAAYILKGLEEEGHTVDHLADGRDAVAQAVTENYDVIILDRMLPSLDGLAIIKTIRSAGRGVPVLFLTALGGVNDRVEGLDAGADDYLVKPVSPVEVRARIRSGLRAVDAQRQLAERVAQLEAAMKRVSSLESLLPLCMYCRRINSSDAWQSVEDYLWEHVDVRVSHGCCPDCLSKLSRQLGGG